MRTIALCGNQNAGKTTLFNRLTGDTQRVGNWPGVTVAKRSAHLLSQYAPENQAICVDLPGIYALTPYTPEERITKDYILHETPDVIINVIDANILSRGLYLTLELMALRRPMVLCLNMIDTLEKTGNQIDLQKLSNILGIPVIAISARNGKNIKQLISAALSSSLTIAPSLFPFDSNIQNIPAHLHWAQERYHWIDRIVPQVLQLSTHTKISAIDRLATHGIIAYPMLALVFAGILFISFGSSGQALSQLLSRIFAASIGLVDTLLHLANTAPLLRSLIVDGALSGISAVLSFLPPILLLFLLLGILEDSGFMARASWVLDKPLRLLGLSGRSFLPLVTGFGCSVPALLSLQTLPESKERKTTAFLLPFIPCGAKVPVFIYLTSRYWGHHAIPLTLTLYCTGIFATMLCALCLKTRYRSNIQTPFLLELPPWKLPSLHGLKCVLRHKIQDFLSRAFTVVFLSSLLLWALNTFTPQFTIVKANEQSLLSFLASIFSPICAPLGFGEPAAISALFAGLLGKENIISALALSKATFSPASALSFAVFAALYTPCAATLAVMRKEIKGRKRMLQTIVFQSALAWLTAFLCYQITSYLV